MIIFPALGWGSLVTSIRLRETLGGAWGMRLILGLAVITLLFFVFGVVLALPLGDTARSIAIIGGIIFLIEIYYAHKHQSLVDVLSHPIIIFSATLIIIFIFADIADYIPYSWDEYANWLAVSKKIFYTDALFYPEMSYVHPEYPPGWRLLLAYPSFLRGGFNEYHSLFLLSVMHFSVLGLVYETTILKLESQTFLSGNNKKLISWLILLLLISVEATWKLIPTDMLIERPQIYVIVASTLIAMIAIESRNSHLILGIQLGLLMAFGYLLKSAMLVFVPSLLIILGYLAFTNMPLIRRFPYKNLIHIFSFLRFFLYAIVPIIFVYLFWSELKTASRCTSAVVHLLSWDSFVLITTDNAAQLANDFIKAIFEYLIAYKLPITLFALISLFVALRDPKLRIVTLFLFVFFATYLVALYWNYLICSEDFNKYLSSLERYVRVPLRTLHLVGVMVGFIMIYRGTKKILENYSALIEVKTNFFRIIWIVVMFFSVGLIWQSHNSVVETHAREREPYLGSRVKLIKNELESLVALLAKGKIKKSQVLLVSLDKVGFDILVARYYAIGKMTKTTFSPSDFSRLELKEDRPLFFKSDNFINKIRNAVKRGKIIWFLDRPSGGHHIFSKFIKNPICVEKPDKYFIFSGAKGLDNYLCVKK